MFKSYQINFVNCLLLNKTHAIITGKDVKKRTGSVIEGTMGVRKHGGRKKGERSST